MCIQEVVFRDTIAHFSRLVPPKPGEQYVLYETDEQAVTGGDPEFYNHPDDRSFMAGGVEDDRLGQVSV